jgi:uncharacterized protein DUF6941
MPFENGPLVTAAALCEQVLQEPDGVISLIRVVDKVTSTDVDTERPGVMPSFPVTLTLALLLKAGDAQGRSFTLRLQPIDPGGKVIASSELPLRFAASPAAGATFLVRLALVVNQPGQHWIRVTLDDEPFTRVPLLIEHQPPAIMSPEPAPI